MTLERRLGAGMLETPTDDPGLVLDEDGTVWLVAADGTRTQVGGGSEAGSGPLLVLTAHIPSVTLLALDNVTSYELLAAPGAGKVIYPLHYFAVVTGTTPYDWLSGPGGSAELFVGESGNGLNVQGIGDLITLTPPYPAWGSSPPSGQGFGDLSDPEDHPLVLYASDSPINGDLDLDLTIYYVIVDLP